MLAIERQNNINEYLMLHRSASVTALAAMLCVTEETIRRDLRTMEEKEMLVRTHGGAFIPEKAKNTLSLDARGKVNLASKAFIAAECAKMIFNGETLFLDSSTTAAQLARAIVDKTLTVITNSFTISNILTQYPNIHLILLGGDYDAGMSAFINPLTLRYIEEYYVDKAFFSCRSIDLHSGLTDIHDSICNLRRRAITLCKYSFCIADRSKFDRSSYIRLCDFSSIDALITDSPLSPAWRKCLDDNNVWYLGKDEPFPGRERP